MRNCAYTLAVIKIEVKYAKTCHPNLQRNLGEISPMSNFTHRISYSLTFSTEKPPPVAIRNCVSKDLLQVHFTQLCSLAHYYITLLCRATIIPAGQPSFLTVLMSSSDYLKCSYVFKPIGASISGIW